VTNSPRLAVVLVLRFYQRWVSPAFGPRCRYYPSCSEYAVQAVQQFGIVRGLVLAGWRLLRCNPLSHGGFDPVDEQRLFRPKPQAAPATRTTAPSI
jgi:putative membrane protein insertion efficiency factor